MQTALLLLALISIISISSCSTVLVLAQQEEIGRIAVSTPEIYPDFQGPFNGMVQVTFAVHSKDSEVHYKLNDTSTAPTKADRKYVSGEPVQITATGATTVSAVAVPTGAGAEKRGDSSVVSRTFIVVRSEVQPPVANPPPGTFVGSVEVRLRTPPHDGGMCETVLYSIDDPAPGEQWVTANRGASSIELDVIGMHTIFAKCVDKTKKKESAVIRYRYEIQPSLMYEVGSECSKCDFRPTEGEYFTVALQGFTEQSTFFLTTSVSGCERDMHPLDFSKKTVVSDEKRTFKFFASEYGHVWLCVRPPGASEFQIVPRRHSSATNFLIEKAVAGSKTNWNNKYPPAENTPSPPHHQDTYVQAAGTGFSAGALVLALLLIAGCAFVGKLVKSSFLDGKNNIINSLRRRKAPGAGGADGDNEGNSMVPK